MKTVGMMQAVKVGLIHHPKPVSSLTVMRRYKEHGHQQVYVLYLIHALTPGNNLTDHHQLCFNSLEIVRFSSISVYMRTSAIGLIKNTPADAMSTQAHEVLQLR